ncbi:MAG: type III polyketide synthase, partial [Luteolibacter sp.]
MYLRSLATAVPPRSFTQTACWEAMKEGDFLTSLKPRSAALMEKILCGGSSGITRRNLALESITEAFDLSAEALSHNFEREAPPLASTALKDALEKAGYLPGEVDALFI